MLLKNNITSFSDSKDILKKSTSLSSENSKILNTRSIESSSNSLNNSESSENSENSNDNNNNNNQSSESSENSSNNSDENSSDNSDSNISNDNISFNMTLNEKIKSFNSIDNIVSLTDKREPIVVFKKPSDFEVACRFI
eukprot:jgi/Orpsp1_1/1180799/evm.model.c7180000074662.1